MNVYHANSKKSSAFYKKKYNHFFVIIVKSLWLFFQKFPCSKTIKNFQRNTNRIKIYCRQSSWSVITENVNQTIVYITNSVVALFRVLKNSVQLNNFINVKNSSLTKATCATYSCGRSAIVFQQHSICSTTKLYWFIFLNNIL